MYKDKTVSLKMNHKIDHITLMINKNLGTFKLDF